VVIRLGLACKIKAAIKKGDLSPFFIAIINTINLSVQFNKAQ